MLVKGNQVVVSTSDRSMFRSVTVPNVASLKHDPPSNWRTWDTLPLINVYDDTIESGRKLEIQKDISREARRRPMKSILGAVSAVQGATPLKRETPLGSSLGPPMHSNPLPYDVIYASF